ncbi:MAG: ATP-dependent Clp protease ATP-binding subunit ClpX, partial [Pseudoflavonifractor sp.]
TQVMYDVPSDPTISKVTITGECVEDRTQPAIEHDPDRKERPRLGSAALRAEKGGLAAKDNVS